MAAALGDKLNEALRKREKTLIHLCGNFLRIEKIRILNNV